MDFKKNGIVISVSDLVVEQLVLERLRAEESTDAALTIQPGVLPRIGAEIVELGGVFAGVVRGAEGQPDYYLIVGPEAPSKLEWRAANEWADTLEHLGFADFTIFNRREQSICFGNVPELFQKEWYWSNEQHAGLSSSAWAQDFGSGGQDYCSKGSDFRARAVRRSPIQ